MPSTSRFPKLGIVLAFALATLAQAQESSFTLKLWPDKIPGAVASASYQENVVYRDNDKDKPRYAKVTDPTLQVFLPASNPKGTAVVVCPGGGYSVLAYDHEGIQVAKWFNEQGVAAIVLKYRLPSDEIMSDKKVGPLQDVQEAIRTVRRKAAEWHLNPAHIGVMGFSAGGHLAGTASTLYGESVYPVADGVSARPDFSILVYGVISMQPEITHKGSHDNLLGSGATKALEDRFSSELRVDANTPPAFLLHSEDDRTVPVENSIRYYLALVKNKVPGELHVYQQGGHGYGLGNRPGAPAHWPEDLKQWLKLRELL